MEAKQGVFYLFPGFGGHLLSALCQIIRLQSPLHAQTSAQLFLKYIQLAEAWQADSTHSF